MRDRSQSDLGVDLCDMLLFYGDHAGNETLRDLVAAQSGGELRPRRADSLTWARSGT